jgi:predicted ATP-dependent endonuclease of OLD family
MKEMEFPQDVKMTFISEDGKGEFKLSEIDFPLFYGYLRYFDLIENIIDIYNNEEEERKWNFLEKTFDLISSYRNYNNVNMQMDLEPDQNTDLSKNFKKQVAQNMTLTANSGEPAIFKKVLFDIFKKYAYLQKKYTEEKAKEEIENYVIFKNIKEKVNDFLKFDINIKPVSKNSIAKFRLEFSRGKEIININELSAGEKAIIHLIFAIYGSKANNGCLLIDEPEQHLHPQWQIKFREILEEEICEDRTNYQIIIATHSPSFLSIGTINNVLRFHISEDGGIDIKKPEIKEEERFFLEILKYTNCSKIFFVNKAILVEGETDNYFWNWYLEKKCKNIRDYEVYDIKGKENYEKWVDFLERWGIEVFYICDLDNIRNMSIIDDDECEKLIRGENIFKRIKNKIKKKNSLDGAVLLEALDGIIKKGFKLNKTDKRNIKDLWRYIKLRHQGVNRKMLFSFPCIKLKVYKRINNLYRKNIFILKIGELEDYTGTSKNKDKVGKVISFCNKEESLKRGQREIDFISEIILGTKELS